MSLLKYFSKINTNPTSSLPQSDNESTDDSQEDKIKKCFTVWTDGSCLSNGTKNAIGGIGVFFNDNSPLNISEPMKPKKGPVTNNICELEAVRRAILAAVNQEDYEFEDDIIIYTDSQYLINCINKWSNTWAQNGWTRKNSKGKKVPVKNKELIQNVKGLCIKYQVVLTHCKAHTTFHGVEGSREYTIWYGNKRADELAVAGSQMN
jgi:ribonuclease HI